MRTVDPYLPKLLRFSDRKATVRIYVVDVSRPYDTQSPHV